jgi:peptidoglycan/xylan/chitin deacetylase (PgdA/CDA1 family)
MMNRQQATVIRMANAVRSHGYNAAGPKRWIGALLMLVVALAGPAQADNLLQNGDLSQALENGSLPGWDRVRKCRIETVEGQKTLVLDGSHASAKQRIQLDPSWKGLSLSMRMKVTGVELGDANWKKARASVDFKGADGKHVGPWPYLFQYSGTTDWLVCNREYAIPDNAVQADFEVINWGKAGKIEVQDLQLTAAVPFQQAGGVRPVIILKLDDVTRATPHWQRCYDFIRQQDIKASFGIIGFAMERDDQRLFDWIRTVAAEKQVEFWNHGFHNRSRADKLGEFESSSVEAQKEALLKTQRLVKEKTGVCLTAFGPHWSGTNAGTVEALDAVPEIDKVFFYTQGGDSRFVFKRFMDMEKPTFNPVFSFVKKNFEAWAYKKPYLCLQGHPNSWTDARFEEFKKIVLYFKEQGCRFMTASEYVDQLSTIK